jgi:hypothetical protein
MIERRKARRYDLALHAVVHSNVEIVSRTKNISTDGLFLLLHQPIATDFNMTIELPTGVYVKAVARTVRTKEWTQQGQRFIGVGVVIERHEIVRPAPSQRLR